jgi:hypothetical protein
MSVERDKKGRFQPGHKGVGGRPSGGKGKQIDVEVGREKRKWLREVRDIIGDKVPSLAATLINASALIYKSILEIRAKDELSANDIDRMNKLTTSLRLNVSEIHRFCHRERKRRAEEEVKKKSGYTRHPCGMY